jgi:diaminopimelate decarboxylase
MGSQFYQAPCIERNVPGLMNKFGNGHDQRLCERIAGLDVEALAREHGSPLFVFDERALRDKYRQAYRAFSTRYPEVRFAWSYKTNYLQAICRIFHQEGALAEVVSDFEYAKARRLGVPGPDIILNGPYKTPALLRQAVKDGAKIHLDNHDELLAVEALAEELQIIIPVGIRINMDTGAYPAWTKFGFNLENQEALRVIRRIGSSKHLRLAGLHTHIGTFILDPNAYRVAVTKLLELIDLVQREFDLTLDYLDLGGGFASNNTLHTQYLPGEGVTPSLDQYAEAICDTLLAGLPGNRPRPTLYLESGRALIDESGYLISSVIAQKRTPEGRRALIIDAGVNLLYTANWYRLGTLPARDIPGPFSDAILYGPLCMNIDVIREHVHLPQLRTGDRLVLHPVGAYNVVQSMQFITYRPRVVLISPSGAVEVIREREALADVEAMERMPARLA